MGKGLCWCRLLDRQRSGSCDFAHLNLVFRHSLNLGKIIQFVKRTHVIVVRGKRTKPAWGWGQFLDISKYVFNYVFPRRLGILEQVSNI